VTDFIAGETIKGSWWGHPKGQEIYALFNKIEEDSDLLICRLINGKVTFVHSRIWAVAAVVLLKSLARNGRKAAPDPQLHYRRRPALFTPAERSFAGVLDQVLDARYRVYGKVRVADLIEPLPGKDRRIWQKAFNRISAKHFDFVICNSSDLVPVVVI
jgi:hypothetical protein